jgi:AcrR family transcriptional regulator
MPPLTSYADEPVHVRRQMRRNQRRDRVYDAAVALFVKHGYDGATMHDIAAEAGVARTSVFNYFSRKSAFLDDWAARRRDVAFGSIRDTDAPLRVKLEQFMSGIAGASIRTRDETVAMFGPAVRELNLLDDSALATELTELIEDSGAQVAAADPALLGSILATGYFAVLYAWCAPGPPPFDLEARLLQLIRLAAEGFESRQGATRRSTP